MRVVDADWREFYSGRFMWNTFVPEHGSVRTGKPGFDGYFSQNNGDFRVRIKINMDGFRNPEPASAAAGQIWVIGDSMAFGWGVEDAETYTEVIERVSGHPAYNIASPGANVCGYQRLSVLMPQGARPAAVVVGLILENDLAYYDCANQDTERKNQDEQIYEGILPTDISDVKQVLLKNSALYNFLAVSLKRIDIIRELLILTGLVKAPTAGGSHFSGRDSAVPVDKTVAELSRLRAMFGPDTPFLVAVAPTRYELAHDGPADREVREMVIAKLAEAGIPSLDLRAPLSSRPFAETHFRHDGHWTPLGHALAGRAIAEALKPRLRPRTEG